MNSIRDTLRDAILGFFKKRDGHIVTICCFLILFWLVLTLTADAGLIGFYPGNDQPGVVAGIVGEPDLLLLGKIETDGLNMTYEGAGDHFGIDYFAVPDYKGWHYNYYLANWAADGGLFMSGSVYQIGDTFDVDYFTIKAGNGFNLYSWDDDLDFQTWSSYNTCADISHASFYGTASVPEPSSFVMLLGLCVCAALYWQCKKWCPGGNAQGVKI